MQKCFVNVTKRVYLGQSPNTRMVSLQGYMSKTRHYMPNFFGQGDGFGLRDVRHLVRQVISDLKVDGHRYFSAYVQMVM